MPSQNAQAIQKESTSSQDHKRIHKASLDKIILLSHSYPERNIAKQSQSSLPEYIKRPCQTEILRSPSQDRIQILDFHCGMFNFSASLPSEATLKVLARLKCSGPLYKTEYKFSLLTMYSLTFKPIPSAPYNFSSRAFADILSASLSVYFTSIGRYFFSSFTFPEDLAISTRFFIAVRSSGLIFNTLL